MEDPIPCEIIKCEPAELDLLPESVDTFPYGLSCDSENNEDNVLDIFEPSAMVIEDELKHSAEPVAMFEFVGLLASTDDEGATKEAASEKNMLGKMRENIVKALCENDSGTISKLSDPIPIVGNKLVSQMKTVINTIIGCEENNEWSVDGSSDEDTPQLGPNLYFCEKCCKYFNQKSDLKRHSIIHVLKYRCAACNMGFQMKCTLINHLRHTVCGMPFKCKVCGLAFKHKSKLFRHQKRHSAGEFSCTKCSKAFKYEESFLKHQSVCQDSCLKCSVCKRVFCGSEALKAHVAVHVVDEKPYLCDACGKRFMRESFYRRHTMIFCGQGNKCDTCGKIFKEVGKLRIHCLTHETTNYYKCERCSMTFKDRAALKLHAQKYINEDGYRCHCCHKLFLFKSELLKHNLFHSASRSLGCNKCGASFSYESSLRAHMILHSLDPHVCGKCGMELESEDALKLHKRTHFKSFSCHFCDTTFYEASDFKMHIQAHSNAKGLACKTCGKKFRNIRSLASHALVHNVKRKHTCSVCSQTFKYKRALKKHTHLAHG